MAEPQDVTTPAPEAPAPAEETQPVPAAAETPVDPQPVEPNPAFQGAGHVTAGPDDDTIVNELTNSEVIEQLPKFKNEAGVEQVVIDENGQVKGL